MSELPVQRLVHADWSKHPTGRWVAKATREGGGWIAEGPCPVGPLEPFVADLFDTGSRAPVLAGFDFPIGLPVSYARRTGLPDFLTALDTFGAAGAWSDFYRVAETTGEIAICRPFYPMRPGPKGTVSHRQQLTALDFTDMSELRRSCEQGGNGLKAASPMFWTLGAASVGKAALHGWQEVIVPARRRGARIWPFDGPLAGAAGVTLAETYPGDAYGQIGLSLAGKAKTSLADRQSLATHLQQWASAHSVCLGTSLVSAIEEGFNVKHGSDNGFDAVVGLFAMIAVLTGERPSGEPVYPDIRRWEGWILGRRAG